MRQPEAVTALTEMVREKIRVNVERALSLADLALSISHEIADQGSLARALRAKANVLYASGQHAAAVEHHEQAVKCFEATGNTHEVARTLSGSIQPMLLMGDYERAFAAADRAREIFSAEGNTWRLARLEINVGNIFYRQDRFQDAISCYERAYLGLENQQDSEGIAAVLSNMATCYISLHAFSKALELIGRHASSALRMKCLCWCRRPTTTSPIFTTNGANTAKTIEMLRAARIACKKVNDSYHFALCNLDLAELYLELNLGSDAAELAQQGCEGFRKLGMGYESAKCLAFSAIAASQQGHAFEGLKLFSEAREIFVQEKNQAWPSLIDLYRALVFYNEGRFFEARRIAADTLEAFVRLNLSSKAVLAELLLARISMRIDDVEQAHRHVNGASKNRQPGIARSGVPGPSVDGKHSLQKGQRRSGLFVLSGREAGGGGGGGGGGAAGRADRLQQEIAWKSMSTWWNSA